MGDARGKGRRPGSPLRCTAIGPKGRYIYGQNRPSRPMVPHIIRGGVNPLELYDGTAHYSTGYWALWHREPYIKATVVALSS